MTARAAPGSLTSGRAIVRLDLPRRIPLSGAHPLVKEARHFCPPSGHQPVNRVNQSEEGGCFFSLKSYNIPAYSLCMSISPHS